MISLKCLPVLFSLSVWLNNSPAMAQYTTAAAGGDGIGPGGSLAYTAGQIVYTTSAGVSGTIAQGVQQAYEVWTGQITEVNMKLLFSCFPNPVSNLLHIWQQGHCNSYVKCRLTNSTGSEVMEFIDFNNKFQIDMSNLAAGTYILLLGLDDRQSVIYKIVKL